MNDAASGGETERLRINVTERSGGSLLMEISGYLDASNFDRLEKTIEKALDGGRFRVIADIAGLNYINSAGVGVLLAAISRARAAGGDVVLVSPAPSVADVFSMVGMDKFSRIADTVAEAEEIFRQPNA